MSGPTTGDQLTAAILSPAPFGDQDRAILEFERLQWIAAGSKNQEIITRFAMTPVRYYARLNWIIDQPEALAYDAVHVNALLRPRRCRDVRTRGTVAAGVTTRPDPRGIRPAMFDGTPR